MKALAARAQREQIPVLYDTPAVALLQGDNGVAGVRVRHQAGSSICGRSGGAGLRRLRGQCRDARPLSRARLGSRQGARQPLQHRPGLRMALDIGAAPAGHWSGAHACAWDINAPPFGDLDVGDRFQKHG